MTRSRCAMVGREVSKQVEKTLPSTSHTATEESRGTRAERRPVITHKDKWMCRRGSTFSDAISSSHLLLDSFQVDSLQDTAAIYGGGPGGKQQTHARV